MSKNYHIVADDGIDLFEGVCDDGYEALAEVAGQLAFGKANGGSPTGVKHEYAISVVRADLVPRMVFVVFEQVKNASRREMWKFVRFSRDYKA